MFFYGLSWHVLVTVKWNKNTLASLLFLFSKSFWWNKKQNEANMLTTLFSHFNLWYSDICKLIQNMHTATWWLYIQGQWLVLYTECRIYCAAMSRLLSHISYLILLGKTMQYWKSKDFLKTDKNSSVDWSEDFFLKNLILTQLLRKMVKIHLYMRCNFWNRVFMKQIRWCK